MNGLDNEPILRVEPVQLQFRVSDLTALVVSNNVLVMALATNRLLRIDLTDPQNVDDIDLPKKADTGSIKALFIDTSGNHLLITTSNGDNYYLHSKWTKAKPLSRLKSLHIECIAWSRKATMSSTKEILAGTRDGSIYEFSIEPADEYFKREERYLKMVYKLNQSITGIFASDIPNKADGRRILLSTATRLYHFTGKVSKSMAESSPLYIRFFDSATMTYREFGPTKQQVPLAISPISDAEDPHFAWLSGSGIYHGKLVSVSEFDLGVATFAESQLLPFSKIPQEQSISQLLLTKYHLICLCGSHLHAINVLDEKVVFTEDLESSTEERILSLCSDMQQATFWFVTNSKIFEIVAANEDRDMWKVLLDRRAYDAALRVAKTLAQKDAVNIAAADHLVQRSQYKEAASLYGNTTKSFEEVTLLLLEQGETDALLKYLQSKLSHLKKRMFMQRTMLASWIVELYMARLNALDDTTEQIIESAVEELRESYQRFVLKYKFDLNRETVYEIISSHGREKELLFYANTIDDHQYILAYWINRETWNDALAVLNRHSNAESFYKYATVLLSHMPRETVDIWVRHTLEPLRLIPAILHYSHQTKSSISEHQGIRYLLFAINQLHSPESAIHNTLISIYATHPSHDESGLLHYLEVYGKDPCYDSDFALRLCMENNRLQSCVHIYSSMQLYDGAVELALQHKNVELASIVADRPDDNVLRKKLWLTIARNVISTSSSVKEAIQFAKRCPLLKIEDLIPFFPDFVVIDDFKEEVCAALEEYTHHIDVLKRDMDESANTAETIDNDISELSKRYAIVEVGERCFICLYPLLSRQFYVFPCQHTFHADCLLQRVVQTSPSWQKLRITELQAAVQSKQGGNSENVAEMAEIIASECALCGDAMINSISQPFLEQNDPQTDQWRI